MASETRFIYNNIIVVFVNPSFKNSNIVFSSEGALYVIPVSVSEGTDFGQKKKI